MTHFRRTYRSNAFTTTSVNVVSSARALSRAASHKGVGIRSDLGIVSPATPTPTR